MAAAFSFQRHSEQLHDQLAESRQTSVRLTKQLQEWHKKYFDVRHDMSQLVHEHDSAMQSARLRDMELQQIITHLELQNTQLEYDKRVVSASLHDLEAKYNRLLEEKALWQHDNEIRWQLEEHNQRLKDEVSEANVEIYALRSKMIKMELRLKEVESIHLRTELTGAQRDFETRSHRLKTLQATLNPPQPQQQQPPSLPQQTLQSQSQALQSANHESQQTTTAVTASTFSATDAAAGAATGGGETAEASMPRPPPASSATSNVAGGNAISSDAPRRPTSNDHRALETDGLGISSASHEQGVTMAESFSHTHHQHVEHHQPRQSHQSVYQSEQQHRQQNLQHSVRIQTSASHSSMRQTRSQTQNASDAAESTSATRPRSASPSRTAASHTQQRNASMTSVIKPTTAVSPVVLTRSASPEHRRMSAQSTAAQPTSSMQSVARTRTASASSPTITQPPFRTKKTAGSPQSASLFLGSTSATTTHETSRRRTSSSTIKSSAVSAAPAPKPASAASVFHAPAGTQRSASPTHQPPQQAAAQPAWVEPAPQRAKPPSMTPYQQQQHQHQHQHQMQQQQLQQRRSLSQSPTRSAHQHQHQHQPASAAPPSTAATNRYARLPPPPPPPSTHGPANPVLSRPTRPPPPPPVQSSNHHVYSHSQKTSSSAYRQTSWSASLSDGSMDDSDPAFDSAAMQQTAYSNRSSNSARPSTAPMHRAPEPYPDQVPAPAPAPAPVRPSDAERPRYLGGATHFTTDNSKDASISLDDIPASVASQAVRLVHDESQLSLLSVSEYDPGRPIATGRSSPAPQMAMGKSTDTIVRSHAELPPLPVKADAVAGADKTGGSGFLGEKDGGSAVGHTQDRFATISQSSVDVRNRVIEMESKSVQQTVQQQQQQQQKRPNTSLMDTATDTVTSASQSQHSIRGSEAVSPQNAPFAGAWGPPAKPRQPSVQLSRPFFAGAVVGAQAHSQQQHSTRHDSFDHSSSTPLSSRSFSPLPSALPSQQSLGHQPSQPAQPVQPHTSLTGAIVAAASPSVGMSGDGVRTSAITDAKGYASPAIQALSALVRKRLLAERVYPSFLPLPVHNTAALLADVEMTIYRAELFLDRLDAFVLGIPFDEVEPSEEQQLQLRRALSRITESPAASRASQRASVSHSRASSARSVSDDSQASRSSVWSHSARGHSRRSADSRSRSRSSSISENAELDRKPYSQHPSTHGNMSGHESNGAGDLARDASAEPESIPHGYAGGGSSTDAMAKGGYNMASQSLE
ncbi:hypothetical protein BC831DRAFT_33345 [Entophlyctis helioformis]|nr:hypothetical protein BC831DRAFT_33345 [Entophlyctis helioformis]